ncbi:MAG: alanine racemase [Oscillospiraceae bacterium]|nr:alanine racemase [Oscillospiraceae bacterium]
MYAQDRTWAEISLKNIAHNFRELSNAVGDGVKVLGVVKANAYGHGAVQIAAALLEAGCQYLAVATVGEAAELRENGIDAPILILGSTSAQDSDEVISRGLTQSLASFEDAARLSEAAVRAGRRVKVHLKLDTGMGRLGFVCRGGELDPIIEALSLPNLDFEGVFTHFAVSEIPDDDYTRMQFKVFTDTVSALEEKTGVKFKIRHCANSGAMLNYKETHLDMVRPGIVLYGHYPGADCRHIDLRPAMELKTRIVHIKHVEAGDTLSYGRTYTAPSRRKIATVPIGYADGLMRALSGKADMLLRGKRVKQVGRICMDMCMLDVTDIPDAAVGDTVTVFGRDGDGFISVDEVAEKAGTISYEILCAVSPRVPRIYADK